MQEEALNEQNQQYIPVVSSNKSQTQQNLGTVTSNPFATQAVLGTTIVSKNEGKAMSQQKSKTRGEELRELRDNLLADCSYKQGDDFIIDLDQQILIAESEMSPNRDARR